MSVWDWQKARQAREEAVERVAEHADPDWVVSARRALAWCATQMAELTSDDVWRALDSLGIIAPREPRAMSGVMRYGVSMGWVEMTGRYAPSNNVRSHGRPKRVYISLLR